ncbi:MAG: nicotinamide-nucleotide amidohydrolase family protein [Lachnospiraceae bacterium]|nr:nicotinamide-nucleotide amidohydrolase family protein [Lachnospiraceae bacterium]
MGDKNKTIEENIENEQDGYTSVLKLCGITKAKVNEIAGEFLNENGNPSSEIITEYDEAQELELRLYSVPEGELSAKKVMKPVLKELKNILGENIYAIDSDRTLEEEVVELLKTNNLTICTAESATGGLFTARLVNVPGVSAVLKQGFITYTNKAKRKYLGVKKLSLLKETAASEKVAKEMVKGACASTKADCGISITGLAGPDGGDEKHPVGQIFVGCMVLGNIYVKEYNLKGDRNQVRQQTVSCALSFLRHNMLKYFADTNFGGKSDKK